MSPIAYIAAIIAAAVVLFVWNKLPVVIVAMATALALWATQVLHSGPGAGRIRRPGRHLHRLPLRRQRRARDDRRHRLGRAASDPRRRRGEPDAPASSDHEPRGRADRPDQRQRRGCRSAAGRGRHGGPAEAEIVAAPDAAGLFRPCGIDAGADRHAGERPRLGGRVEAGVGELRLLRVRPRRACRCSLARWRSSSCSANVFCPSATAPRCRPTSAAMPRRWWSNTVSPTASSRCACARPRPMSDAARPRIDLSAFPGVQLVAVQEGESAAPLRRPLAEGDHMLLRGDAEAAAALAAQMHLAFREDAPPAKAKKPCSTAVRSGRSGDPAALGLDRADRVSGHGHRERRPDRPRGAARPEPRSAPRTGVAAGGIVLQAGDTMLLQGTWKALDVHLSDPDVLVVSSPELVRRQAVPHGTGRLQAIAILIGMVFCSRPASCRLPWPACSPPALSSCRAS